MVGLVSSFQCHDRDFYRNLCVSYIIMGYIVAVCYYFPTSSLTPASVFNLIHFFMVSIDDWFGVFIFPRLIFSFFSSFFKVTWIFIRCWLDEEDSCVFRFATALSLSLCLSSLFSLFLLKSEDQEDIECNWTSWFKVKMWKQYVYFVSVTSDLRNVLNKSRWIFIFSNKVTLNHSTHKIGLVLTNHVENIWKLANKESNLIHREWE